MSMKILLVCHASPVIGLGHFSRLLALAKVLTKSTKVVPEFLIFGDSLGRDELAKFKTFFMPVTSNFVTSVKNWVVVHEPKMVVFDIFTGYKDIDYINLFLWMTERHIYKVCIDALVELFDYVDLVWIPSFAFDFTKYPNQISNLKFGWDSFLIQKRLENQTWKEGLKVLVLTGGGDVTKLGDTLPKQLDMLLNHNVEIEWVKGPFADAPILPRKPRLKWNIHNAPAQLDELIVQANYVLTVYGVSFFEVIQYGVPTVVFSPYGIKDNEELIALQKEQVAAVSFDVNAAIKNITTLMKNQKLAKFYSERSQKKLSKNGAENLSKNIISMLGV